MSFEVVEPGAWSRPEPLEPGRCAISRGAKLTLRSVDLEAAGIGPHFAIVLADAETLRLGLRAAGETERQQSVAISVVTSGKDKRDSGRRIILVSQALKRLALTPEAVAGRYTLQRHSEVTGTVLIVNLCEAGELLQEAKARSSRQPDGRDGKGKGRGVK